MNIFDIHNVNGDSVGFAQANSNRFKVCAYNVGNFCRGTSGTPAGTDEMYDQFVNAFRASAADVYMFSEWDEYWTTSPQVKSVDVFGKFRPHHSPDSLVTTSGSYIGQMIYSDAPHLSDTRTMFEDGQSRCFVDSVISINGKDIHFICTHLPVSPSSLRRSDIQKVFNYISQNNIMYYVFGGDFNLGLDNSISTEEGRIANARSEVTLIESYGGVSLQGGQWGLKEKDGFFDTTHGSSFIPIDNIVISQNMYFRNCEVIANSASDHDILVAEIELI